jgi:hypothetical protein
MTRLHEDIWKLTSCLEPVDQYLRSFQWNKVKYRADKPIAELINSLQKVSNVHGNH